MVRAFFPRHFPLVVTPAVWVADRAEAARPEEEAEGDLQRRAGPRHGRPDEGMVPTAAAQGVPSGVR